MAAQPNVPARGQYAPFMGPNAAQFANLGSLNASSGAGTEGETHATSTIFKSSVGSSSGTGPDGGNYSNKYRHSLDA